MKIDVIFQFTDVYEREIDGRLESAPVVCQRKLGIEMADSIDKIKEAVNRMVVDQMPKMIEQVKTDLDAEICANIAYWKEVAATKQKSRTVTLTGDSLKPLLPVKEPHAG